MIKKKFREDVKLQNLYWLTRNNAASAYTYPGLYSFLKAEIDVPLYQKFRKSLGYKVFKFLEMYN